MVYRANDFEINVRRQSVTCNKANDKPSLAITHAHLTLKRKKNDDLGLIL